MRAKGDEYFRQLTIDVTTTLQELEELIRNKLQKADSAVMQRILLLPDVLIVDNQDVFNLATGSELQVEFE